MTKSVTLTAILILATLTSSAAMAAKPGDLIKYRQSVMKAIGGHMGAIAAIIRGKVDYDHLPHHALGLQAASKSVADTFPPESATGKTDAKATIWENPGAFAEIVSKFEQAADGFLEAANSGNMERIGGALRSLGGTCKGCHDDFRQKKR